MSHVPQDIADRLVATIAEATADMPEFSPSVLARVRQPLPIIPLTHALPVETGPLVENYSPIGWSPSQPCKGAA